MPDPTIPTEKKERVRYIAAHVVFYGALVLAPIIFLVALWILIESIGGTGGIFMQIFIGVVLILAPLLLVPAAIKTRLAYKRALFFAAQGYSLLEIKVPKEITKSPLAMEVLLEAFHKTSHETTFIDRWIRGKTRPWFSLELVSLGGEVHFFIWTRKTWRRYIESAVYAQYPEVEIYEVEDYTSYVPFDLSNYVIWGCEFRLSKPDPFPIKTYIEYGMDKEMKEEFKVDPMSASMEFLGSLKPGENIWIQILIRAHGKDKRKPGTFFTYKDWKDDGKKIIEKIIKDSAPSISIPNQGDAQGAPPLNLTMWQNDMIKSIERNLSKRAFDCGIRTLYLAKNDVFDAITISALINVFKQFSSEHMNGLSPTRGHAGLDYPWQDYRDIRRNKIAWRLYDAYKRRSYFYAPYRSPSFVMSNEELATIYHVPGEAVGTPTLPRITSRKRNAPANLPR